MRQPINSFTPQVFREPVSFNCTVNNKLLTAEIIEQLDDPITFGFKIKFSDGASVEATSTESGKWWVNDIRKLGHVKAIEKELRDFVSVKDNEWDKFELEHKGNPVLIWLKKSIKEELGMVYSVYYEGSYQFDLQKVKNSWKSSCVRVRDKSIDEPLAVLVARRIDLIEESVPA